MSTQRLSLDRIRLDGGTQARVQMDPDALANYHERIADLPPPTVFFDGEHYWLADGFHRVAVYAMAERKYIDTIVKRGTVRDAILFAVGANQKHGLRRTQADKRHAVGLLLADEEWSKRSSVWIAKQCGVSDKLVTDIKRATSEIRGSDERTLGRDGKRRRKPKRKPNGQPPLIPDSDIGLDLREPSPDPEDSGIDKRTRPEIAASIAFITSLPEFARLTSQHDPAVAARGTGRRKAHAVASRQIIAWLERYITELEEQENTHAA